MAKEDGGPAFTVKSESGQSSGRLYPGMSLRDWFAGMALQGLLSKQAHSTSFRLEDDATYCYKLADAMLQEKNK